MVHGVTGGRFPVDFLVVDLVALGQRFQFARVRAQREEARVECLHVTLEQFERVAFRIHRDKKALQLVTAGAKQFLYLRQFRHGSRAHIRTLGIAKEHHHHLAGEIAQAANLAIVVAKLKSIGIGCPGNVNGGKSRLLLGATRKKANSPRNHCASSYNFNSISFR